jgi:hypothetical protein
MAPANNLKPLDPEGIDLRYLAKRLSWVIAGVASIVVAFWAVVIYVLGHYAMKYW